jgi:hypothetical protein
MFCFLYAAAPAFAEKAGDMAEGTWAKDGEYSNPRYLTFGDYNGHALKWRVLEVYGNKTALLVLDDVLRERDGTAATMNFDADTVDGVGTNNFPASDICLWLNDDDNDTADDDGINGFVFSAGLNDYQAGILDTEYGPDTPFPIDNTEDGKYTWHGETQTGKSKIFLLSVDDATNPNYFVDGEKTDDDEYMFGAYSDRDLGHEYWLRSPGFSNVHAAVVIPGGQVNNFIGNNVGHQYAVRPALKIDISSPVLTSVSLLD